MSARMDAAWRVRLPPPAKLVLLSIAQDVDELGYGNGDERAIAARTGLTKAEARELVKRLLDAGILTRTKRWHGDSWRWAYDLGGVP